MYAVSRASEAVDGFIKNIDLSPIGNFILRLGEALTRLLPPNLQEVPSSRWPEVTRIAREEQLCLAWVPSPETTTALLDAGDATAREDLLVANATFILADCLDTVTAVENDVRQQLASQERLAATCPDLTTHVRASLRFYPDVITLLRESITVAQAGHYAAAQALATCVTDSVLTQDIASGWPGIQTYVKKYLNAEQQSAFRVTVVDVLETVKAVYARHVTWQNQTQTADAPARYDRHATSHAAASSAYTTVAALKAVILATSTLAASNHPLVRMALDNLLPVARALPTDALA